jgi:hypothetical protein
VIVLTIEARIIRNPSSADDQILCRRHAARLGRYGDG